jgi:high affinity Mn2+ porin
MANNKSARCSGCILLLGTLAFGLPSEAAHGADVTPPQDLEAGVESHDRSAEPEYPLWDLKFQATYIRQEKFGFDAPYTGPNSLSTTKEKSYSLSATAYLGIRAWTSGEFYLNAEMLQGVAFSNLQGMGGFTNAELEKVAGANPIFYVPRVFVRQAWSMGGGSDHVESAPNQLAGTVDKRRLVLTIGKMSIPDVFDDNVFSHDVRTQFMNLAAVEYGAFDIAADARGYTIGAAMEYYHDDWVLRAGRFMVPRESNGLQLNFSIMKYHGDQIEVEHAHSIGGQPGKLRLLYFRNVARMGKFRDALDYATNNGGIPAVANVRKSNAKQGYGASLEQNLTSDLGLFARTSWADGETETYSFTEIERSQQVGFVLKGTGWDRGRDDIGVVFVRNGLSSVHRAYLAAGGLGFFIGDGRLNYHPEQIIEGYYSVALSGANAVSFDVQRIVNPAYNGDRRGPVNVVGVRLHLEF